MEDKFFNWLPGDEVLESFYAGMDQFINDHLPQVITTNAKPKEILDPCVGYVKLERWEVAILDTALFQRLRRITQLGLANLVYPTLGYSRLEHTIGVLGRLSQTLQTLKEKKHPVSDAVNEYIPAEEIINRYETAIRLAALFHDVGHCLFSHLSEDVVNHLEGKGDYPSVATIKKIFRESFTNLNVGLSIAEILSITILGHRRVAEVLYKNHIYRAGVKNENTIQTPDDLQEILNQAARFIAGVPIETDAKTIFLAQLISSGLDVDKLDYMSREEHFSGIKIEMDLQRILNKLKLFHIADESSLPKELISYSHNLSHKIRKDFIVLGIEKGGQFSYEEFCVARLALYEKIYLHKKVRAAEAFLKKKLYKLVHVSPAYQYVHNWLYLRESIVEKRFEYIDESFKYGKSGQLNLGLTPVELETIKFTEISDRVIPHRAFGFGPANSKTDSDISKRAEYGGIEENHLILDSVRFWRLLNPNKCFEPEKETLIGDLSVKILQESVNILFEIRKANAKRTNYIDTLMQLFNLKEVDLKQLDQKETEIRDRIYKMLEDKFLIDVPDYRRVQLKYETLNFEEASYQTVRWTIPIDQIARYYQLHRILAYVYANQDYCPLIHVAAEKVIYRYLNYTNLVFDQTQVVPKEMHKNILEVKRFLGKDKIDYYKNANDLLPINEDLLKVSSKIKINQILHKLNKLMYFNNKGLTYLDVENFLKQFKESIQLPALDLLNSIEVLNNNDLYDELHKKITVINSVGDQHAIGILPLGSYMSSSSYMLKEFYPFFQKNNIELLSLSNYDKIKDIKHILLIDDNINTGRQAVNIVAKMLGTAKEKLGDLYQPKVHSSDGEGGVIENDLIKEVFTSVPLTFIFITGYADSKENLENYLHDICGLNNCEVIIKHVLADQDRFFSGTADPYLTEYQRSKNIFQVSRSNFKQSSSKSGELKRTLELIGRQVVNTRSIVTTYKEKPTEHCMGYKNREGTVIFPGSVPTMTITALWCSGEYKDENGNQKTWKALIERPHHH